MIAAVFLFAACVFFAVVVASEIRFRRKLRAIHDRYRTERARLVNQAIAELPDCEPALGPPDSAWTCEPSEALEDEGEA